MVKCNQKIKEDNSKENLIKLLKEGNIKEFNKINKEIPQIIDLSKANLSKADLSWADLSWADLSKANYWKTNFCSCKLTEKTKEEIIKIIGFRK